MINRAFAYHGTSTRYLPEILKHGIRPRKRTKVSNWNKFKSRDDLVYFTTAYPWYFAMNAVADHEGDSPVVVEVAITGLNPSRLYPDEDFVAQIFAEAQKKTLEEVHPEVRKHLEEYRQKWWLSLEKMGTFSHRGTVPVKAISRYTVIDAKKRNELMMAALDPIISYMNYMVMGEFYEKLVAWTFGDERLLPQVKQNEGYMNIPGADPIKAQLEKTVRFWKEQSVDREGIKVVNLGRRSHVADGA